MITPLKRKTVSIISKKVQELPWGSTKIKCKGTKLSDGETVDGVGRLSDAVVDKIKIYPGYVLRNNRDKNENIISAIWGGILSHDLLPK